MDFVAFDFETANHRSDSACQLALVSVRQGVIEAEHSWLIRPPRMYFSRRNIAIHGIHPEHVTQAQTMEQLWPELSRLLEGRLLVAHNAGFDIGVLVSSLEAYEIACPHLEFSCTRAIARRTWPGRPRYGLAPLGSWLRIDFRHHDALEDARCCAQIALTAAKTIEANDFGDLEKRLRLTRGRYSLGQIRGPRMVGGRSLDSTFRTHASVSTNSVRRGQIDSGAVIEASNGSLPLAGKGIVCLGCLRGLDQAATRKLIEALGAQWQTQISPQTDYVVACGGTLLAEATQWVAKSAERLEQNSPDEPQPSLADAPMSSNRAGIRLLSERQFLALVPGGKSAVRW